MRLPWNHRPPVKPLARGRSEGTGSRQPHTVHMHVCRQAEREREREEDTTDMHAHHGRVPLGQSQTQPVNEILPWQPIKLTTAWGEVNKHRDK